MEFWLLFKALAALAFIIILILLFAKVGQIYLKGKFNIIPQSRQLKVTERFALDAKRSLVRFQDNQHTYLVLLGQQGEQLLHKEALMLEGAHDSYL